MDRLDETIGDAVQSLPAAKIDAATAQKIITRASARPQRRGIGVLIRRAFTFALTPWPEDMMPKAAALGVIAGAMFLSGFFAGTSSGTADVDAAMLALIFADIESLEVL